MLETRSSVQCLHRWTKILKPGLIKGPWTFEEDKKLSDWVKTHGPNKWSLCANNIEGRSGKQCRERWYNSLCPEVKKGNWTSVEDFMIFKSYKEYGSKWARIASFLKGRTENSIKNRFYSTLRRIAYENQKKDITQNISREKVVSQKDLIQFLPEALQEKEYLYNLEKPNDKSTFENNKYSFNGSKKVKIKTIIHDGKTKEPAVCDVHTVSVMNEGRPIVLNTPDINVNFKNEFTMPESNQIYQFLNNLLTFKMNCLKHLYQQKEDEVLNYKNHPKYSF
jgi:hypothetical protein